MCSRKTRHVTNCCKRPIVTMSQRVNSFNSSVWATTLILTNFSAFSFHSIVEMTRRRFVFRSKTHSHKLTSEFQTFSSNSLTSEFQTLKVVEVAYKRFKLNCYTSQLKYVFRLEKNVTCRGSKLPGANKTH